MDNLYEKIVSANSTIHTTQIKGKDYAEVPQRIKAFRMVFPEGFIKTELLSDIDGVCTFKATCGTYTKDGPVVLGTGHAYENEKSSFINKTSYIENCETSAVGRALGMAGFGIDTSIASAEEVQNAILNQGEKKKPVEREDNYYSEVTPKQHAEAKAAQDDGTPITDTNLETLRKMLTDDQAFAICTKYRVENLGELTDAQAADTIRKMKKRAAQK